MRVCRRLVPSLLVVLGFWHGDVLLRGLAPSLELIGNLFAPGWSLQWVVDGPDMELVLHASPRTPRFLAPSVVLPAGTGLQSRVPLRPLLLPVALGWLCLAVARPPFELRLFAAITAWLPVASLIEALGLVELSLAREAAALGYEQPELPWLLLLGVLEAGGRWLPCVVAALAVQRVAWRSVQRHQEIPTTDAISAGNSHSCAAGNAAGARSASQ